jgi:hypothetical protein
MKDFSPEDLLEYYYGEMNTEKSRKLEERLVIDWTLREKLEIIKEACEKLDKSLEPPRKKSVDFIIEYAEAHLSATI